MKTYYNIINSKYNVTFDLKFDSFYNFIESLKESKKSYHKYLKKSYHKYLKKSNVNIKDFDNEYVENINILKSDLLKYYILTNDDSDCDKYVIVNDTIRELYKFMTEQFKQNTFIMRQFFDDDMIEQYDFHISVPGRCYRKYEQLEFNYKPKQMYLLENDKIFMSNININYLTRDDISRLIDIYASNTIRYEHFKVGFCKKMNIDTESLSCGGNDSCKITDKYVNSKHIYLDTLTYETTKINLKIYFCY